MAVENVAIKVEGVYKNFLLPHEKNTTVKSAFLSLVRKRKIHSNEIQHALKDVSFDIQKGEFFGIVGRNGSGKSTLLKMLAGIYQPTKGNISVNGKLVPFIELGVGFNPELSGRDNVYLNGALLGFSRAEVDKMYDEIVEFAELEKFMDQKLKNYSSGMQVRLAFSMAVKAEADVLLVDEVLAVGDADFQRKCFEYFKQLKRAKKTVVFVTHDMNAVREFCDKAVLIDNSELKMAGSADEVAQEYTKLFMSESNNIKKGNSSRWGEGQLEITNVRSDKKVYTDNDKSITIDVDFIARKSYEGLVSGIGIQDASGNNIYGTNTQIKKVKLPNLEPDQDFSISWQCPNILADGKHSVVVTLHDPSGLTIYDWWDGALELSVRREERTLYPITPDIKITTSKK